MKNVLLISFINLVLLLGTTLFCAADSHLDYYSLHNEQVTISYLDGNNELKQEARQGFLNIYDIEDPKISCHNEFICAPDPGSDITTLPTIILGSAGISPPTSKKQKFRVFIPEGTVQINLTLFCQQTGLVASAIKFDDPPDCQQCTQKYSNINFSQEDSFAFESFESNEIYLQNAGGHINIYTKALLPPDISGQNPPRTKGGWLYINNFYNDSAIGQIQFGIKVHKETFSNWYTSYKAAVDADVKNDTFGLLSGSSVTPDPSDPSVPSDPTPSPGDGTDLSVGLSTIPTTGVPPFQVTFTPTISNGTSPYSYTWNFGDGNTGTDVPSSSVGGITHTYTTEGTYYVTLTVTDQEGKTAVATTQIISALTPTKTYDEGYTEGYAAGKQYCIDNPIKCGIITIGDNFDVFLNSVDYTIPGIPGSPWNIQLMYINNNWELGVVQTPADAKAAQATAP